MGQFWLSRAIAEKDKAIKIEHLEIARSYFGRAWKLDDRAPEVYAMYGRSFLVQGEFQQALDSLEAANRLLPSNIGVRLDLALANVGVENFEEARRHTLAVRAWSHSKSGYSKKAKKLLKRIDALIADSEKSD